MNPGPSNPEINTVKPGTDVAFECYALPSTSRSLPMRRCKKAMVHYDDDSCSSDDADTNFVETEQPNLIESTKNSIQNEENADKDENHQKLPYYGENSDEDSDPYGYRAELLGQNGQNTSSDDDC